MQPLPHEYTVNAAASSTGSVRLGSGDLPALSSSPPVQFGGPGDEWSPEELLLAAVADCFVLTFRAVALASRLPWKSIDARVDGVLARADRVTRFTEITVHADLSVAKDEVTEEDAIRALEKAERGCLVSNSLAVPTKLVARVQRQ